MSLAMRTTLTLDPDVARLLDEEVHRQRKPFKEVVNDALRRGLTQSPRRPAAKFRIVPHEARLQAGIATDRMNRLADELEDEGVVKATRR